MLTAVLFTFISAIIIFVHVGGWSEVCDLLAKLNLFVCLLAKLKLFVCLSVLVIIVFFIECWLACCHWYLYHRSFDRTALPRLV
jgi:hypothetical protein